MENLSIQLSEFYDFLDHTIEDTWSYEQTESYIMALSKGLEKIVGKAVTIGDFSYQQLVSTPSGLLVEGNLPHYVINYLWSEEVKSFLILWRDILFQQHKATIYHVETKADKLSIDGLKSQSKVAILNSKDSLVSFFDEKLKTVNKSKRTIKTALEKWKLEQNPWQIYKEQLQELPIQNKQLQNSYGNLLNSSDYFGDIRGIVQTMIDTIQKEVEKVSTIITKTKGYIEENITEKPGKVVSYLEDVEEQFTPALFSSELTLNLDEKVEALESKVRVPIDTIRGIVQYKEVNFQRLTRQWLDSEILPVVYEMWEIVEKVENGIQMSLVNIRNKALVLSKEDTIVEVEQEDISSSLINFLKRIDNYKAQLDNYEKTIQKRIERNLYVTKLYETDQEFLSIPLTSTINQYRQNQTQIFSEFRNIIKQSKQFIRRLRNTVQNEEILSSSEKIVRFIESRQLSTDGGLYSSIFLTKGYIGESFWVGRKRELNHVAKIIKQWENGFRGAVLISGQRFSGKSLFGELVANRFFPHKSIHVFPNSTININGRKFETSHNLDEALNFIKNQTLNDKYMVWLDNLALWTDVEQSLGENVRSLKRYIDNYSGKLFFMVSVSNWLLAHLENTEDIRSVFQTEINLDRMEEEEIKQAVLIRHGATHKALVDQEGEEITPQGFERIISNIVKVSEGNIGEALNRWAGSIQLSDDDRVQYEGQLQYTLPEFLDADMAIVLSTIMMEKRTNEFRLRKRFGVAFKDKYRGIIQRLIGIGVLKRQIDGWLMLNDSIANEIGKQLETKGFLKFYH